MRTPDATFTFSVEVVIFSNLFSPRQKSRSKTALEETRVPGKGGRPLDATTTSEDLIQYKAYAFLC